MGRNRGKRAGLPDRVLYESSAVLSEDDSVCVLCCVDDTDDLSGETSTGYVAERIADTVAGFGGSVVHGVTRHQLLLNEEIAYTSHNSAMCLMAYLPDSAKVMEGFRERAIELLEELSVDDADPGICMAAISRRASEASGSRFTREVEALSSFGRAAQTRVCTKEEAYALAESIPWVHLSEHGGTGIGVIGALAGVGLRLEGSDGRFRGKWNLSSILSETDGVRSVGDFCRSLAPLVRGDVRVVDREGGRVAEETCIVLGAEAKPILHEGALTFVVDMHDGLAHPAQKVDLGTIGNSTRWDTVCERFALDADPEERSGSTERRCINCLYRRWTPRGFACTTD